eukprot:GILI01012937.1.p1 GENE.GILI01012937.1~~GILI01012937.1.p1  ORF type:complete len:236 (+),score=23.66 GILI01012937.1:34-708(+)
MERAPSESEECEKAVNSVTYARIFVKNVIKKGNPVSEQNALALSTIFDKFYWPTEDSPKVPLNDILRWEVSTEGEFRTKHLRFFYQTSNGDEDSFPLGQRGFSKSKKERPDLMDKLGAMRFAIRDQIMAWRESNRLDRISVCGVCDKPLGDGPLQVDHDTPTFAELAESWADSVGGFGEVRVHDVGGVLVLTDSQAASWNAFHLEKAVLRRLHAKCNLARAIPL